MKQCYDCGTTHNIRCISDGWGPIKPEYSCEGCFISTDEGPCWDETGPLTQAETTEESEEDQQERRLGSIPGEIQGIS